VTLGYDANATARWVAEPPKRAGRSDFERDRARVLHSAALRRLAAKTQVVRATSADFPRTRLTHSLECAQIGRELGQEIGCDPDLVDAACLAHDIGHSPFGHNGEAALNELAAAIGGFEGNAQTLRLLTRLEPKTEGAGLNLTRATLDATLKYPWFGEPGTKFGAYAEDAEVFGWIRQGAPDRRPCLEAQVMDWADDVAYSVHDAEDGIIGGYVRLDLLVKDQDERKGLCGDAAEVYSGESAVDLGAELAGLLADPAVAAVTDFDGTSGSYVRLKRLASVLIGRFVSAAVRATRDAYGHDPLSRYGADLIVPRPVRAQCALLKAIALRYVMRRPGSAGRYAQEQSILRELVVQLAERAPDALDPVFSPLWLAADGDAARLRVVVDQVASLTDPAAIAWHRSLTG
jgi:dGTPase